MIEGLKLRVTSAELKAHLKAKAEYHRKRAADKTAQLPGLKAALDAIKAASPAQAVTQMVKGGSYALDNEDTVERLERDITDHANRSLAFDYFSEHLFDDDYTLGRNDLVELEVVKR